MRIFIRKISCVLLTSSIQLIAFCLLCCPLLINAQQRLLPEGFDSYVDQVLKTFDVPGLSVGIVKDGEIILTKGYGVKKLGEPDPVNEETLFSIASNSKAFTATALAMLIEEGKLKWEDRVTQYLPWFQLSDDYVTSHLTVRDLLVHHSGLPAYANDLLLFPPSTFSRQELLQKLRDVPLQYDFRSVYAYDNILYLAAGEIIEKVSGLPWEEFIKKRIFDVLGMKHSISRFSSLKKQDNVAYAHAKREGQLKVIASFFDQNIGDAGDPAGGIASSALDMTKWVAMHLDSGRTTNGGRLFKANATEELWKIIRPMPIPKEPAWLRPAQKNFYGYALGFRKYDYRGYQVIGHGGLLTGFVSQIAMVPQKRLGIVVLTNQLSSGAYWSIINYLLDYYLQAPAFDWIGGYKKEADRLQSRRDSTEKTLTPDSTLRRSLPLNAYCGAYVSKLLGNVRILEEQGLLSLKFINAPQLNASLTHFHGDIFKLTFDNRDRSTAPMLSFSLNPDKSIREANFISSFTDADSDWESVVLKPAKEAVTDTLMLTKKINEILQTGAQGTFAIAFKDLSDNDTYFYNEHEVFHAASTMKTPVLAEAFRQMEQGKFSLTDSVEVYNKFKSIYDGSPYSIHASDDSEQGLYALLGTKVTIADLLHRMITQSSNLATNIVIDLVGAKNVMKTMRQLGAKEMKILRGVEDSKAFAHGMNNTVSAHDLLLLFEQLAKDSMVSKQASEEMVAILMQQHFRGTIPAKLPGTVKVANKTGSIDKVFHDSGIVFLPDGRRYVLILLSKGLEEKRAQESLAEVSSVFYHYMTNKIRTE
ncbi:serine hydrolase [Olivibacter sp. XZL3]|uniref:serine hydrolase n=1 Tax=Olivibacter sp. XZL3 TaxID=1735116 RepID=UPI001F0DCCB4|nr:serine hydrolase [Olivibacter sp. XZL3]